MEERKKKIDTLGPITEEETKAFKEKMKTTGLDKITEEV
jgi:hypothetical protein